MNWEEVFLIIPVPLSQTFPIAMQDNSGVLSLKPQNAWMRKTLTAAEMTKIKHQLGVSMHNAAYRSDRNWKWSARTVLRSNMLGLRHYCSYRLSK